MGSGGSNCKEYVIVSTICVSQFHENISKVLQGKTYQNASHGIIKLAPRGQVITDYHSAGNLTVSARNKIQPTDCLLGAQR